MSPHLYIGMSSNCLNFEGKQFLSIHGLYIYVYALSIAGLGNCSIRPSTPSRSKVQGCFNAEKLFETSNAVIGRNIKDNYYIFSSNLNHFPSTYHVIEFSQQ